MKKIVLTGGGTAGHVMPLVAIIEQLKNTHQIFYIGSHNGIEKDIISQFPSVRYYSVSTAKLARQIKLSNLTMPFKLIKGYLQSKRILKDISPNIIFSKGGYVSIPTVFAGNKLGVPIISHESDLSLGLANKLALKKSTIICCSFKKTLSELGNKGVYTGTPFKQKMFMGNKDKAYKECGFANPNKPIIMFFGGSLGAQYINSVLLNTLNDLTKNYNVIHIVGKGNKSNIKNNSYYQIEFTNEIENFLAISTLVVSRAGSNSINELLALQKPMILIPLPSTHSRGDQLQNANEFEKEGYCKVLLQKDLNPNSLLKTINQTMLQKEALIKNMQKTKNLNGTKKVIELIKQYQT